jgi:hypothetical protein
MQKHFLFVVSFEHVNFAINGKYFQKNYDNLIIMLLFLFSSIQKYSFKECPFIWVATFIVTLPSGESSKRK